MKEVEEGKLGMGRSEVNSKVRDGIIEVVVKVGGVDAGEICGGKEKK